MAVSLTFLYQILMKPLPTFRVSITKLAETIPEAVSARMFPTINVSINGFINVFPINGNY